mmetsp:Transcript_16599/g.28265  ORF Transcript_16599/g.28265 Transcript_16599/m.28265 type:complete len:141 (-) Transcript_16599:102-524(-)
MLHNAMGEQLAYYLIVVYKYDEESEEYALVSYMDQLYKQVFVGSYDPSNIYPNIQPLAYGYPLSGSDLTSKPGRTKPLLTLGRNFLEPKSSLNLMFGVLDTVAQTESPSEMEQEDFIDSLESKYRVEIVFAKEEKDSLLG